MKNKKVSVIILNWNGLEDTTACLDTILKDNYDNKEVIVVDNGSKVNEANILLKKYGDKIRVVWSEANLGYCGGNNLGFNEIGQKDGGYTLILNNDTQAEQGLISKLSFFLDENESIGAVGAMIMDFKERDKVQARGLLFNPWFGTATVLDNGLRHNKATTIKPNSVSGACFMIRNSLIKNNQIFDERFFCYWEEVDLCLRLKKQNYDIAICNEALVYHKDHSSSSKKSGFFEYQTTKNKFYIIQKHTSGFQKAFIITVTVILYTPVKLLLSLVRFDWPAIQARLRGLYDGLKIILKD